MQIAKVEELLGHKDAIYKVKFKDSILYSAGADAALVAWDLENENKGALVANTLSGIYTFTVDDANVCLGLRDGSIVLLDLNLKHIIFNIAYQCGSAFVLKRFTSTSFLVGFENGFLYQIDQNGNTIKKVEVSKKAIRSLLIDYKNNMLIVGTSDANIYLLDFKLNVQNTLSHHKNSIFSLAMHRSEKYFLSGSRDATLGVWDTNSQLFKAAVPAHMYTINAIAASPNGKLIATASRDKSVKIWDAKSLELLKVMDREKYKEAHSHSVNTLCWHPELPILATAGDDKKICLWFFK